MWAQVVEHRRRFDASGEGARKRRDQQVKWMWTMLQARLSRRLRGDRGEGAPARTCKGGGGRRAVAHFRVEEIAACSTCRWKSLLVAGFGAFPGRSLNPAQKSSKRFARRKRPLAFGSRPACRGLPVDVPTSRAALPPVRRKPRPTPCCCSAWPPAAKPSRSRRRAQPGHSAAARRAPSNRPGADNRPRRPGILVPLPRRRASPRRRARKNSQPTPPSTPATTSATRRSICRC